MMKWLRVILGVILTLVVILVAGFLLWASAMTGLVS